MTSLFENGERSVEQLEEGAVLLRGFASGEAVELVQEVERQISTPLTMYVVYDFDEDTTVPVVRRLAENRPWLRL